MASKVLLFSLLLLCLFGTCFASGLFADLKRTLFVDASPQPGEVLKVEDKITVKWGLNQTFPATEDDEYHTAKVKLCYAPVSQKDRAWRKTKRELNKDKTCQFKMVERAYSNRGQQSFEWTIERDIPTATYFIRAYVFNSKGHEVAFGQTTNEKKTSNLFEIQGISGRHASIDIAAGCFSGFSILSLFGFFYLEKRKGKNSEKN